MACITKEWKNITGYETLYKVSNYGEVKAKRRVVYDIVDGERQPVSVTKEKLMSLIDHGNGYVYVTLCDENGQRKNFYVHRLVAEAFLPNPDNLPQVNHLDYDRKNNKVTNLEWCTSTENVRHSLCNQPLTRKSCHTNTGYKYITKRGSKYSKPFRVCIKVMDKRADKPFRTLQEAIDYRNTVAKELGIEIKDNIN